MRDAIFAKIRAATAGLGSKAPLPDYDEAVTHAKPRLDGSEDPWEVFHRNFRAVNGRPMRSVTELAEFLIQTGQTRGYCDPALFDRLGGALEAAGLTVGTVYDREHYDELQFGITRASGAIAESGAVILDDELTSGRLAALTPWVHVAVLDETAPIHRTIGDALAALGESPNVIWCTGPSKTADVEGILIEGVHGPGEQIALRL